MAEKPQYINTLHIHSYNDELFIDVEVWQFIQQLICIMNEDGIAHFKISPKETPTQKHSHVAIVNTYKPKDKR